MREQGHSVVRLNVMQTVTEHLEQCVENSPSMTLEHIGKQGTCR